ncbi:MAG: tRNA dihydrouridine(20/20a) synthase DusA [bacterium]|nr:tRNA dihydrouridine(20/20a) synthase DusA [bacterium]
MKKISMHRFSVAPMMDWTDRHCRSFMRLLTRRAVLYTEMLHARAVIHGKREQLLGFSSGQSPLVLQLGGSEPDELAQAARIGADYGYDEINLNVGCPSERVQSGNFGAALMLEPDLTSRLVEAMREAVAIPVTVKCRIGVDEQDIEKDLDRFIDKVANAGCEHFVVHARKAWLSGLSPKNNREVPPLDYDRVYLLKQRRTDLQISINGGIETLEQCTLHGEQVDGTMLGRAAYHNPFILALVDYQIYRDEDLSLTRAQVVEAMVPYIERELVNGVRLSSITRHMMGLYLNEPGARYWRQHLSVEACKDGAGVSVVLDAMALVERIREEAVCRVS